MTNLVTAGPHTVTMNDEQHPEPEVPERARARTYSASYKLCVLAEYETLPKDGKGACCGARACIAR
jgi:hypothetical protein